MWTHPTAKAWSSRGRVFDKGELKGTEIPSKLEPEHVFDRGSGGREERGERLKMRDEEEKDEERRG